MEIPQYHVHDFSFLARVSKNPYDVQFLATFHAPDGSEFTLPGFCDGDDTWIVRFAPTQLGEWWFETRSDVSGLDPKQVRDIVCVPNTNPHIHGRLWVDQRHPHHFRYEDGSRCLPLGDECDWLFAFSESAYRRYLDRLCAYGFNHVLMQVYAHAARWSEGQRQRLVPPLYPWAGSNERPDHTHMNPAFWQHLDGILHYMHRRGILAQLMIEVHNKGVSWPGRGQGNDDRYWCYVLARYQAFSNVIWSLSKEMWKLQDDEYWASRVALVRQWDAYSHLLTAHDVALEQGDFLADQHHQDYHAHILEQRNLHPWPVMNVEYGYEPGPIPTYPQITLPDEMRCRTWEIVTAGGYPVYYYADTAWDVVDLTPLPEGYRAFHILRQVMERLPYEEMEPHDELVSRGYCLAKPGEAYLLYLPEGGRVTMDAGPLGWNVARPQALWVNPRTGQEIPAGPLYPGVNSWMTPSSFGAGDAVLLAYQPPTL